MAIVTKIREKAMVAVTVVAVAMAFFILGSDLLSGRSWLLNAITGPSMVVGEIDGNKVGIEEFNATVEEIRKRFFEAYGRDPQDTEMERLRQQAWQMAMYKYAYGPEFEELGITVSQKEFEELLSGENISPNVSAYFQRDGQVDREMLKNFMDTYTSNPRYNALYKWITYSLKEERMFEKYSGMLASSGYATKAEAKREYNEQNTKVDMQFLYIPYSSIPDSTVKVSDDQLKAYYSENEKKYERDANREIEYVAFPLEATADDEKVIMDELAQELEKFKTTTDDTAYVGAKSDGSNNFLDARLSELPQGANFAKLEKGEVAGPVKDGKSFKIFKIVGLTPDSTAWASASHILFKEEDLATAQTVLKELQGGADFAAMAMQHSTDPSNKGKGGDLGWFDEKTMVEPFAKAVFGAKSTGVLPTLVKTQFGHHIIKVNAVPTKQRVQVAVVEKEIIPSRDTQNAVYRRVGEFSKYKTYAELKKATEDNKIVMWQALNVPKNGNSINNITGPSVRQVIRWAYNDDTEEMTASEPFDLDNQYVIAVVTKKREKGIAPFEDVKAEVKAEVVKKEQAKQILAKLGTVSDLQQSAQAYGPAASTGHADGTTLSGFSVSRIGFAPKTLGKVSGLPVNQLSSPIEDENGIVVVKVETIQPPVETADFTSYRTRIEERRNGMVYMQMQRALEITKEINDTRYKFF